HPKPLSRARERDFELRALMRTGLSPVRHIIPPRVTTGSEEGSASRTTGGGSRGRGPRTTGGRTAAQTNKLTIRRLRSAFFLWKSALRGRDVAIAAALVVIATVIGAYLYARARREASALFEARASRLQAAVKERLESPKGDLRALRSFFEASG